jgi:anti-anti-sigma factor
VSLAGEIDCSNAGAVQALLPEFAVADHDLHVDLRRVDFIDVAGVRALVGAARTMNGGRRLVVHGGPSSLHVVLETTGWAELDQLRLAGHEEERPR